MLLTTINCHSLPLICGSRGLKNNQVENPLWTLGCVDASLAAHYETAKPLVTMGIEFPVQANRWKI